jgi:hypothetical protein
MGGRWGVDIAHAIKHESGQVNGVEWANLVNLVIIMDRAYLVKWMSQNSVFWVDCGIDWAFFNPREEKGRAMKGALIMPCG